MSFLWVVGILMVINLFDKYWCGCQRFLLIFVDLEAQVEEALALMVQKRTSMRPKLCAPGYVSLLFVHNSLFLARFRKEIINIALSILRNTLFLCVCTSIDLCAHF